MYKIGVRVTGISQRFSYIRFPIDIHAGSGRYNTIRYLYVIFRIFLGIVFFSSRDIMELNNSSPFGFSIFKTPLNIVFMIDCVPSVLVFNGCTDANFTVGTSYYKHAHNIMLKWSLLFQNI